RCVGLVAVTPLRAGPSCGLPGQAPEQRDWVKIQSAKSSKVGQDSTGVDTGSVLANSHSLSRKWKGRRARTGYFEYVVSNPGDQWFQLTRAGAPPRLLSCRLCSSSSGRVRVLCVGALH